MAPRTPAVARPTAEADPAARRDGRLFLLMVGAVAAAEVVALLASEGDPAARREERVFLLTVGALAAAVMAALLACRLLR